MLSIEKPTTVLIEDVPVLVNDEVLGTVAAHVVSHNKVEVVAAVAAVLSATFCVFNTFGFHWASKSIFYVAGYFVQFELSVEP